MKFKNLELVALYLVFGIPALERVLSNEPNTFLSILLSGSSIVAGFIVNSFVSNNQDSVRKLESNLKEAEDKLKQEGFTKRGNEWIKL